MKSNQENSSNKPPAEQDNDKRASAACIRCRNRKTKCSGGNPCMRCVASGVKCEYRRKRKRIHVYDTEIEAYMERIKELEQKVGKLEGGKPNNVRAPGPGAGSPARLLLPLYSNSSSSSDANTSIANNILLMFLGLPDKRAVVSAATSPISPLQCPISNGVSIGTSTAEMNASSAFNLQNHPKNQIDIDNTDGVDLSVYLGSGSAELVCWNLKKMLCQPNPLSSKKILISPDFNSLIEESVYDYVLSDKKKPDLFAIESLSLENVEYYLSNVVSFINSGYLTMDPSVFRTNLQKCFTEPNGFGFLNTRILTGDVNGMVETDWLYFFVIKVIMICALGEVYSYENLLGNQPIHSVLNASSTATPGLQYFQVIIHFLPSIFSTFNHSKLNTDANLEVIELLGLISIYLRILDKKNLALMVTINALYMCISLNLHKRSLLVTQHESRVFWSTYCLNRFVSLRIGKSLLLRDVEITIPLPECFDQNNGFTSSEDFSNSSLLIHYIYLAQISEQITNEIYTPPQEASPENSKKFLNSILKIVHNLVEWVTNLPPSLALQLPLKKGKPENRLVYTLHLNCLHHNHLASIPILLNLVKLKYDSKNGVINGFDINDLPRNIKNIVSICIQSSQLTINLFLALYKEKLLRVFGFTDLDYLFSSALVFIMSIVLRLSNPEHTYSCKDYLQVTIDLMGDMKSKGNLVAGGKLNQIIDLMKSLDHPEFQRYYDGPFTREEDEVDTPLPIKSDPFNGTEFANSIADNSSNSHYDFNGISNPSFQFIEDFEIGRDYSNYSYLSEAIGPLVNESGDYNLMVTDEDLMFMNEIIQDFQL